MNWKKMLITFGVVFVVGQVIMFIVHGVILDPTYQSLAELFRPKVEMDNLWWVGMVTALFFAFFFVYIFARGYEGKGVMEGVRFGLIIGGFWTIPSVYGQYMVYSLPYSLIIQWVLYDIVALVIMGILAAFIYKPIEAEAKAA
jgi:hypothetical protein